MLDAMEVGYALHTLGLSAHWSDETTVRFKRK